MENKEQNQIPYKIVSDRLIIRCYEPKDAPIINQIVNRNKEHLISYMPWASELPLPLSAHVEFIRKCRANFDSDVDYTMGIFLRETNTYIGGTGFHKRVGKDGLEIGYWIDEQHTHKGYATEASRLLTSIAFQNFNCQRVVITMDETNIFSKKVPQALGFVWEGKERNKLLDYLGNYHTIERFALLAEEYVQSNLFDIDYCVYNILDEDITKKK